MQKLAALCVIFLALAAPAFSSETAPFWIWDLRVMPPASRQAQFELRQTRAIKNDHVKIWVEKDLSTSAPKVSDTTIAALGTLLSETTPSLSLHPELGVIEIERTYFGAQPTPFSQDRDFNIVVGAMPPYEKNGRKYGFDGFFNPYDQISDKEAQTQEQRSNEHNVLYINALQDLNTDYMRAVVAHELTHLITFGHELDPWLNEMLGEAAMQMTGFFSETDHVESYLKHPEWPLAVNGYGISYGGLSMFSEYLLKNYAPALVGQIAKHSQLNSFAAVEAAYKKPWREIFSGYVAWLYEPTPKSSFVMTKPVSTTAPSETLRIAPNGVLYVEGSLKSEKLSLKVTPTACNSSENVVRTLSLTQVTAVWVQSTPPCTVSKGGTLTDENAFTIQNPMKNL